MYAIFESGGKQYKAEPGVVVKLERLEGNVGDTVVLEKVLMVADGDQLQVGKPLVDGVAVQGRIVEQNRHKKILVYKYKRRKDYSKKIGHRQYYTAVRIEGIGSQSQEAAEA